MANDRAEAKTDAYVFDCKSLPIAPGTRTRARLPRNGEPDPLPTRVWWLLGGALILGVLIGRLL